MKFKTKESELELKDACQGLREAALIFEKECSRFGIEPVVTRVLGKINGDSGVHAAGRAVDFRDETVDAKGRPRFMFTPEQRGLLLERVNKLLPRSDHKSALLWHSFNGGMHHFHMQVPIQWLAGIPKPKDSNKT